MVFSINLGFPLAPHRPSEFLLSFHWTGTASQSTQTTDNPGFNVWCSKYKTGSLALDFHQSAWTLCLSCTAYLCDWHREKQTQSIQYTNHDNILACPYAMSSDGTTFANAKIASCLGSWVPNSSHGGRILICAVCSAQENAFFRMGIILIQKSKNKNHINYL